MNLDDVAAALLPEQRASDTHVYGSVRAVNEDGSYMVQLNASSTLTRCAPFCTAMVGDRVKVVINANGKCDAIGRLGGEIGGGGDGSFDSLTVENNLSIYGAIQMDTSEAIRGIKPASGNYVVAFQAQDNRGNTTVGFGNYHAGSGDTEIYGNGLALFSKTDIRVTSPTAGLTSRQYGVNKVLWSGGLHMTSGHTATLSEAVSAQPQGIVLVWSLYQNGVAGTGHHCFFVPKNVVSTFLGQSHDMFMSMGLFEGISIKSIYIHDTQIVGTSNNTMSGTYNGITYANVSHVLRQVIGV